MDDCATTPHHSNHHACIGESARLVLDSRSFLTARFCRPPDLVLCCLPTLDCGKAHSAWFGVSVRSGVESVGDDGSLPQQHSQLRRRRDARGCALRCWRRGKAHFGAVRIRR